MLSAWSGQERAEVVGLPSVRISRPEDERLVGFLLDTLPLPFAPDRRHTFGHCYQALRDAYSEAADHARPAFDDVVDRLRLPRSARSPLIRLWFSDLTQAVTPAWFGDLYAIEHDLPPGWALFDLGFYLWRGPEGYRLHLVSPRDLCAPADTAELLQQVVAVATRAAADPERSVAELLEAPSVAGAPTTTEPAASTVDLVRRHAERRAGPAVADQEGGLDYHTMDAEVDAAAAELEPGTVVVLPARRDRRFLVRLLACWRAGATAVLVDAGWPAWRRRRALETSGATRTYPWSGDGPATAVPGAPAPAAAPAADAGHVLFTSGTTGDPLAVRVPAPVADTALADLAALLGIEPTDRVAMLSVAAHDPVLRDLGLALRTGATSACRPPTRSRPRTG